MPGKKYTGKHNPHSGPRQVHLNRTAYNPNRWIKEKDRPALPSAPEATRGCCPSCTRKVTWKLQYGKYRLAKDYRRCHGCGERTVLLAYHTRCLPCATATSRCTKCEGDVHAKDTGRTVTASDEEESGSDDDGQDSEEEYDERREAAIEEQLKGLRERDRRVIRRCVARSRYQRAEALLERYRRALQRNPSEHGDEDNDADAHSSQGHSCSGAESNEDEDEDVGNPKKKGIEARASSVEGTDQKVITEAKKGKEEEEEEEEESDDNDPII